jgi:phosphomannomutase
MVKCFDFQKKQFLNIADLCKEKGIDDSVGKTIESSIQEIVDYDLTLAADKLVFYLTHTTTPYNPKSIIENCAWRIQGTDGVRALSSKDELTPLESLNALIDDRKLNRSFCFNYSRLFSKFLENQGNTEHIIAIGEDGRESCADYGLKNSIIQGFKSNNWDVIDLSIVPTPLLVAYSVEYKMPALMITASHNPAIYNGIKLFIDGRKLLLEGKNGEYAFSSLLLNSLNEDVKEDTCKKKVIEIKYPNSLINSIYENIDFEKVKKIVGNRTLILDAANGAFSKIGKEILVQHGLDVTAIASNLGIDNINENCGVASLEEAPTTIKVGEYSSPTIDKVIEIGSKNKDGAIAIVLDGDGDRAFIIQFDTTTQTLHIFDGDLLGYCIVKNFNKNESGLFVSTIESDFTLSTSINKEFNWDTEVVGVGDRWLTANKKNIDYNFVGIERSGHAIIPIRIKDDILLTGNGLYTALYAMQNELSIYEGGYNNRVSIYECDLDLFFRNSELWNRISKLVELNDKYTIISKDFDIDPNLLYFNFIEENCAIGSLYIRKSGTEPKINVCISIRNQDKVMAANLVKQVISNFS